MPTVTVLNKISQKHIVWGLIAAVLFFVLLYSYFVQMTIYYIVERKNIETDVGSRIALIGELESRYGSLQNKITKEFASTLGFVEPKKQLYTEQKRLVQN